MRHNQQIRHAHDCFEAARAAARAGKTNDAIVQLSHGLDYLALGIEYERGYVVNDLSEELSHGKRGSWCT